MNIDENKFYLEQEEIPDDTNSEYKYEEIFVEDTYDEPDDLQNTVRVLNEAAEDITAGENHNGYDLRPNLSTKLCTIDDFVRTFLLKMGMLRTLDNFQIEWFELQEKGLLKLEDLEDVPDIYVRNQSLDDELKHMRHERDKYKSAALKAREMYIKLRGERDFHRLHHRRVAQEKNRLMNDFKQLKNHFSSYEPALEQLKKKYDVAMKEKMLSQLERDRAVGKATGLETTLRSMEQLRLGTGHQLSHITREVSIHSCQKGSTLQVDEHGRGPTQKELVARRLQIEKTKDVASLSSNVQRHPNDSEWPQDLRINPLLAKVRSPPSHFTRSGGFKLTKTWKAHELTVSNLALNCDCTKLVSTGDDHVWNIWSLPNGEKLSTGQGHSDWVSAAEFSIDGKRLATASGDTTVKIWDPKNSQCLLTLSDHSAAVWSVSWHHSSHFLASASMDNLVKIWDLNSKRCRLSFRGHGDSVNSVQFLPYGNSLVTASADKTVTLWDARSGLAAQTFYGHLHAVNHASFNLKADMVVSGDAFGFAKIWDVRACASIVTLDLSHHAANHCIFDSVSSCVAVASGDGTVKMVELANFQVTQLIGHEDAVQACAFDINGDFLVSAGTDLTVRLWS